MTTTLVRRDVLRGLGLVTVVATAPGLLAGCASVEDGPTSDPGARARIFPQGVASGDPTPDTVILWVRAVPDASHSLAVHYEVATDAAFATMVADGNVTTSPDTDHTAKLKLTGLTASTTYYYRFTAQGVVSVVGRTKTAPLPGDDVSPRFAFVTCQDFNGRYFHAYKALLAETPEPEFVLHLGDYIYETEGDPRFQEPSEDRRVTIAEGIVIGEKDAPFKAAFTLGDYRSLYRQYRSDPDLQAAHALFPFINIWDDHEFADDCWQDNATHSNDLEDEQNPTRRKAASRAWNEYQPADVHYDEAAAFPNDILIYRKLRWGKHLEIFLTDQRYFRSDHVIPEGPVDVDVAKLSKNSALGSRAFVLKKGFDPKEAAAKPTMLGQVQKDWLIDSVTSSDATWKVWGSETQVAQLVVNLKDYDVPELYKDLFYLTVDQWDGFRTERKEVLTELATASNVVVLTGDVHAFYASELHPDFDAKTTPTAVEFVVGAAASTSFQEIIERVVEGNATFKSLGLGALVPKMDELIRAAGPHCKFARSKGNGIGIVDVEGESELRVTFLLLKSPVTSKAFDGGIERVVLRTKSGSATIETV